MTDPNQQPSTINDARQQLQLVVAGTGLGFAGILLIFGADSFLPSSIRQELVAAIGIFLVGGGAILTLRGYLTLCFTRLTRFFNDQS